MAAMRTRRTLLTVVTALLALVGTVATPAPASAHAAAGIDPSNFETILDSVEPDVPGVRLRVVEIGSRLELTNTTDDDVVVFGYLEEPYLRVGPDGVFENARSPATYLNASRTGAGALPSTADASAAPSWRRVSDEPTVRWHDHRAHWMGDRLPPAVRRDAGRRHVVNDEWKVPLRVGSTKVTAKGQLLWVPGPSPLPWLGLAVLVFGLLVVSGALLGERSFRWVFGVAVALVLAADVVHTIGSARVVESSLLAQVGSGVTSSPTVLLAWVAAAAAVVLLVWRGSERETEAMLAGGFAGAVLALFGGVMELSTLSRSQVPFAGAHALARLSVAVSLGAGFGLLVAAVVAYRRRAPVASPA